MELMFEVYYKGELLGTCLTSERHDLIRKHVDDPKSISPGDIEFKVIKG